MQLMHSARHSRLGLLFLILVLGAASACGQSSYQGGGRRTDLSDNGFGVSATTGGAEAAAGDSSIDAGSTQCAGAGGIASASGPCL